MRHTRLPLVALVGLAFCAAIVAAAVDAAPDQRRVSIVAQPDLSFDPELFVVDPGEEITVRLTNADAFFRRHDVTFELDGGRVEKTAAIQFPNETEITFTVPTALGPYVYYDSIGDNRERGMEGTMWVGDPPTPTDEAPVTETATHEVTVTPSAAVTDTPTPATATQGAPATHTPTPVASSTPGGDTVLHAPYALR